MRSEIKELVVSLLSLHKALLGFERSCYESKNGPVKDNNEYFNLVVSHEDFKWLRFLSGTIAMLDEEAEQDEIDKGKVAASLEGLKAAIESGSQGEFSARYSAALADSADIMNLDRSVREGIDKLLTK